MPRHPGAHMLDKYRNKIIQGDCLKVMRDMPDDCVDCCITSPPYWGLRDYGVEGQYGLEDTLDEYLSRIVDVFEEVRRLLKPTGTLWLNMGDAYAGGGRTGNNPEYMGKHTMFGKTGWDPGVFGKPTAIPHGLKSKDLIGQPWRLALSLQAKGWYLRSDIIWHKPNPMPESVTDRPTKAHEYLFLLTKNAHYFYDAEAIREPAQLRFDDRPFGNAGGNRRDECRVYKSKKPDGWDTAAGNHGTIHHNGREKGAVSIIQSGRNKRTVWTIATQPMPEAHFATFPEALIDPCIRAGTSEHGNCAECGKPWVRVIEKTVVDNPRSRTFKKDDQRGDNGRMYSEKTTQTVCWQPICECSREITVPGIVFDPFMGSGTVALVAKKLNRDFIGIELNPDYIEIATKRLREVALFL